ncbi:helix-turn-helix domain-containing protein [Streptomyces sp. TX20-6-3]|uniref:helix-turn-helix domain-containing protein n=1 Tax=Streptomyces sp. TX20-6-3 TaxID=3028705 RepID=UPI0029A1FBA9|nr:helix-turn-helix domain-containing protein [Streptomyces sp. TX20-6-3]MDX2562519.1 helix-turn-helix domain-containing protein [Streptomyces sp. TX20-6-3]
MGTQNTSARTSSSSRKGAENHPRRRTRVGGVMHRNVRHTTSFTVVGNHLAQHTALSLVAIGLSTHIQSLPAGAPVDIKTLAAKFPEGTTKIASGLRELELHGYLIRTRERTEDGRMVTRTVSCNHPGRAGDDKDGAQPEPEPAPASEPEPEPAPEPAPASEPALALAPEPAPGPPARRAEPRRRALPAVPQPAYPAPDLLVSALDVLVDIRRVDPRLHLSATDAEHLAPGVAAWLERELTPDAVRRVLTFGLPREPLRRPAALLAHRLSAQLPPLPPFRTPSESPTVRHPLQNCDTCDRAYRAADPGTCHACTPET